VTLLNVVSVALLAAHPSVGGNVVGYILNAGTFVYGPLMIVSKHEPSVPSFVSNQSTRLSSPRSFPTSPTSVP
jgi:hypothetical protein